jgi:DNA-binding MarR family transcriptional regulator
MAADLGDLTRNLSDMDRLIHEPARLAIVMILSTVDSADFIYLMNQIGLTRGNLSSHLSRLEEAGYIEIEKTYRGKIPLTLCRLTDTGQNAFEVYSRQLRELVDKM